MNQKVTVNLPPESLSLARDNPDSQSILLEYISVYLCLALNELLSWWITKGCM